MDEGKENTFTPQKSSCTPRRYVVNQHVSTPLQQIKENEQSENEGSKTPVIFNPFEVNADSLHLPACSPSVFATFARNKTNNGQFKWSIDHVSLLYPADIDETSIPDVWVDPDHETKAQEAIDAFFSQSSIVPSPWSSDSKERRIAKMRRKTRKGSFPACSNDATTQTTLTIPPSLDLMALLGDEFVYNDMYDTAYSSPTSSNSSNSSLRESDAMSSSSLRRKLFATEEECKTPSRLQRKDLLLAKQWSTPTVSMRSIQSTPSDLLSSSPITPPLCSESCTIRTSPQMSPITGPSSQKSFRMRSFNERLDEESNSRLTEKASSQYCHQQGSDISMSFSMDSQDTNTFQSYASSGKQDTGYVTGSMFSLQNMTSDTTNSGFQSRITPVTELFDDCGFSKAALNVSCENISMDSSNSKCKETDSILCGSDKWSLMPDNCSTPALNL